MKLNSPRLRLPPEDISSVARRLMSDHNLGSVAVSEVVDALPPDSFYAHTKLRRKSVEAGMALRETGWTTKSTRSPSIKNGVAVPTSIPTTRYFPPMENS
jgi:hypothetical protein